jgi:predicted PurR-regulated permease PerM
MIKKKRSFKLFIATSFKLIKELNVIFIVAVIGYVLSPVADRFEKVRIKRLFAIKIIFGLFFGFSGLLLVVSIFAFIVFVVGFLIKKYKTSSLYFGSIKEPICLTN